MTTSVDQIRRRGFSYVHNIVLSQLLETLIFELISSSGINATNRDGAEGTTWAASEGDCAVVDKLSMHGADVSIANCTGAAALFYAGSAKSHKAPAVIK